MAPWKFRPRGDEEEVESRMHIELPKVEGRLTPATRESGSRQLYVRRKDLENPDGTKDYTPGCPGCQALMIGAPAVAHSDECRGRIQRKLEQTAEGKRRVEEAFKRVEAQKEKKAKLRVEVSAAPDPLEGEVEASVALGNPERATSPKRKDTKVEKAEKKARAKGTEKRQGTPAEDLYREGIDVDKPEVVQQPTTTAQPNVNVASGSAAPGSDLSHDQFWAPVSTQGEGAREQAQRCEFAISLECG